MSLFIWNTQNRRIYGNRKQIRGGWGKGVERDHQWVRGVFLGDENVLEVVVMAAQFCEYTKNHWIVHVQGSILWYVSHISIFLKAWSTDTAITWMNFQNVMLQLLSLRVWSLCSASHSYWACASGACAPQRERPRWWEARAPRWRVAPARRNWRKPSHRNEDPTQPQINKQINKN